jgi:hypothetical protein
MRVRIALAALAVGLVIAACGSPGKASTSATSADSAIEFAQCMRTHGVPNFPDPTSRGAVQIAPGSGINPQSPAFQSAQSSCQKLLPSSGPPTQMSAGERRAALRFAECMRANGEPNFPDPTETAPSTAARVLVLRGMVFGLTPGTDPKSPVFRTAAARCGVMPPGGA